MLAQAVSKQSEKLETQAAKAKLKTPELDAKKSNGKSQRNLQPGLSPKEGKAGAAGEAEGAVSGKGFLSSLSDVGKSLQKLVSPEAKDKKEPEVAPKAKGPQTAKEPPASEAQDPKSSEKGAGKAQAKEKPADKKKEAGGEKGAKPEKEGAPQKKKEGKAEKSPKTPEEDLAFQSVLKRTKGVAKKEGRHEPPAAKAAQAQAAAKGPPNEVDSQAKQAQVEKMGEQQPGQFDKESFKAALFEKIASITPKNLEEADEFKESNKAASVKESVTATVEKGKESSQQAIKETTAQPPDPKAAEPKEVAELPPTPAGPAPPDVGAQQAAPKPKTDSEVSLEEGSKGLDAEMTEAEVTEEQLANSNEPQFQEALNAKKTAQVHAKEAPVAYRAEEQAILAGSEQEAAALAQVQVMSMHEGRQAAFGKVVANQTTAKSADEQKRAEVSAKIESIYANTKQRVEARLSKLDEEVNSVFDSGINQATSEFESYVSRRMSAYKADRYGGFGGGAKWAWDKLTGMPDEVNAFYEEGRKGYIDKMNVVIDTVASIVETGLNEAKEIIAAGRKEVKTYVESLPKDLKKVGKEAAENIESKFDELNQSLDEKNNQLIDSLSQKYVDNLNKVDERINQMKAENKGLVDKAKDAIVGAIKAILKLKDMLLNVLAKVAGVVSKIIKDPIGFVGNLVKGVKAGLSNFMSKIGEYLQRGLFEWLFGALSGAGIQMPQSLDFKGIVSLVLQVLGLTYPAIRGRAVKLLGEGVVKGLETGSEIFMTLISEGPGGLWKYIQEKIGDLKETVMEGIKSFLKEKIIVAGITWIVGLLNPASAFIKAAKAIYDIVMFFVTRGSQIMSLVDAIIDSMAAIADGGFGVAAAAVEKALGKAVPVVIGFLASLLGLGGISEKIKTIVQKVQAPVAKAVDWVIQKAAGMVRAAGKLVKGIVSKKEKAKDDSGHEEDSEKAAKIQAGLSQILILEKSYAKDGRITLKNAKKVAKEVKRENPVFSALTAAEAKGSLSYEYAASPSRSISSAMQFQFDPEQVYRLISDIARVRFGAALGRAEKKSEKGESDLAIGPEDAPEDLGAQIVSRKKEDIPTVGKTVTMQVGASTVFAKQGKGDVNIIIAGLGNYPEITEKLSKQGYDGPKLHIAIMEALRTGKGVPDVMRLVALLFGAETARLPTASVTAPLSVVSMKDKPIEDVFGSESSAGAFPESMVGARKAGQRAEEKIIGEKSYPEGTKIDTKSKEYVMKVVELTYNAVKDMKISDTDQLRARIVEQLEKFNKEIGVKN